MAIVLLTIGPLGAATIGINFTVTGLDLMAPANQPGVVPGANWTNLVGTKQASANGSQLNLQDGGGNLTSAGITWIAASVWDPFGAPNTANSATNSMYNGGLAGDNIYGEVSITVSNVPYAIYDVYVYTSSASATAAVWLSGQWNGIATTYYYTGGGADVSKVTGLTQIASTSASSPTSADVGYAVFGLQTGQSFTLTTGGSLTNQYSNNVFGLEIVQEDASAVPEPGTFALMVGALGLAALFWRRRLRQSL